MYHYVRNRSKRITNVWLKLKTCGLQLAGRANETWAQMSVLDIGCGSGLDAIFLSQVQMSCMREHTLTILYSWNCVAQSGFGKTIGIDISVSAVRVHASKLCWRVTNLIDRTIVRLRYACLYTCINVLPSDPASSWKCCKPNRSNPVRTSLWY